MKMYYINVRRVLHKTLAFILIVSVVLLGAAYIQGKLEAPTMKRYEPIWQGKANLPALKGYTNPIAGDRV